MKLLIWIKVCHSQVHDLLCTKIIKVFSYKQHHRNLFTVLMIVNWYFDYSMQYKNSFEYLYFFRWYLRDILYKFLCSTSMKLFPYCSAESFGCKTKYQKIHRWIDNNQQMIHITWKIKLMLESKNISNKLFYTKSKLEKNSW